MGIDIQDAETFQEFPATVYSQLVYSCLFWPFTGTALPSLIFPSPGYLWRATHLFQAKPNPPNVPSSPWISVHLIPAGALGLLQNSNFFGHGAQEQPRENFSRVINTY